MESETSQTKFQDKFTNRQCKNLSKRAIQKTASIKLDLHRKTPVSSEMAIKNLSTFVIVFLFAPIFLLCRLDLYLDEISVGS